VKYVFRVEVHSRHQVLGVNLALQVNSRAALKVWLRLKKVAFVRASDSDAHFGGEKMQFLLLIYHQEADYTQLSDKDREALFSEYRTLVEELLAKKQYLGGNQLQLTKTASTVRLRDGQKLVTDGPFAETKEQLGGFFLVEVPDLKAAREIAARMPAARHGSVEVRPVVPMQQSQRA
jgi:hypothetical protein